MGNRYKLSLHTQGNITDKALTALFTSTGDKLFISIILLKLAARGAIQLTLLQSLNKIEMVSFLLQEGCLQFKHLYSMSLFYNCGHIH